MIDVINPYTSKSCIYSMILPGGKASVLIVLLFCTCCVQWSAATCGYSYSPFEIQSGNGWYTIESPLCVYSDNVGLWADVRNGSFDAMSIFADRGDALGATKYETFFRANATFERKFLKFPKGPNISMAAGVPIVFWCLDGPGTDNICRVSEANWTSADCQSCPSGSTREFGECDVNTAQLTDTSCIVTCPPMAGSFRSDSICRLCPRGQYQNQPDQDRCMPCPKGTYSDKFGMTQCTPCPMGNYGKDEGEIRPWCSGPCPNGTYGNAPGLAECSTPTDAPNSKPVRTPTRAPTGRPTLPPVFKAPSSPPMILAPVTPPLSGPRASIPTVPVSPPFSGPVRPIVPVSSPFSGPVRPPASIPTAPVMPPASIPIALPAPVPAPVTIPNANSSIPITFTEFASGSVVITDQYAARHGVIFGPDRAIAVSNTLVPTSPALSGFPFYRGSITGRFVKTKAMGIYENSTVKSFSFTLYTLARSGSTRVEWFDPSGAIIDQTTNTLSGTEVMQIEGGNIASFRIGSVADGLAGFVIDDFSTRTDRSGILFRELRADAQDGSWGPGTLDIPGFDQVALSYLDSVYESHPGYSKGPVYVSKNGVESRTIAVIYGVQNEHSRATFEHNSATVGTSPVKNFQEIPLDDDVALRMRNVIASRVRRAGFLGFTTIEGFVAGLLPGSQKGLANRFTGVGLVEYAAEQVGINGGEGFVPDALESIISANGTFPMLSPELLYFALQNQRLLFAKSVQSIKAYFDPVDYLVIDPLGRKSGYVNRTRYREIPNAVPTPKGNVETLVITNPVPGQYTLQVIGVPGQKGVASLQVSGGVPIQYRTTGGDSSNTAVFVVPVVRGSKGDVNGDGVIDSRDIDALKLKIPLYSVGVADIADINGDRQIDQLDVNDLTRLINLPPARGPTTAPTKAPSSVPQGECPVTASCKNNGFYMHRKRLINSGCRESCTSRRLVRFRLRWRRAYKCGKCPT